MPDDYPVPVVCPRCHGGLSRQTSGFRCEGCSAEYPIIGGLADFRLEPDRFLSIEEDRAKGLRILESAGGDFERALDAYWAQTPETDRALAEAYKQRQKSELAIGESAYADLGGSGPLLDVGCRLGGLVSVASKQRPAIGVDAAFRWLLIARLRDPAATFLCANPEALPFPDGAFDSVHSSDLLEHSADPATVVAECRRVLAQTGSCLTASNNRFSIAPEPHSRLFAVGWLPRSLQTSYVGWRTGRDYSRVRLLSAGELGRIAGGTVEAAPVHTPHLGGPLAAAARVYNRMIAWPPARRLLAAVAPRIQVRLVRSCAE